MFSNKGLVLGLRFDQLAKAYPFRAMVDEAVINDTIGDNDVVIVYYAAEEMTLPTTET